MSILNTLNRVKAKNSYRKKYCQINGENNIFDIDVLQANKAKFKIDGNNNRVDIGCGWKNVCIEIAGNGNEIVCGKDCDFGKFHIYIFGNNNKICLGSRIGGELFFNIGFSFHNIVENAIFEIGDDSTFNGIRGVIIEPESFIKIGKDCMFSNEIELWASDGHSIFDLDGKLLNYAKGITIGDHVWVGKDVKIGKSATIAGHSVVGWNSVVTKKFEEPNVVIAGNPAKVVKTGIDWSRLSPYNYLQQNK